MSEAIKPVTPQETYAIFSIPAIIVDKFYAAQGQTLTRLTFAENVMGTDEKIPRASIALTDQSLAELTQLLNSIYKARIQRNQDLEKPQKPQREDLN